MKQDLASVARSPLLCNSAAEFIETRPEQALGVELASAAGRQTTQYCSEADRFMLNEDVIASVPGHLGSVGHSPLSPVLTKPLTEQDQLPVCRVAREGREAQGSLGRIQL